MTTFVDSYRFAAAGGGFTDPEDIGWHSLFWAEGTAFTALGLSDGNAVATWPNETAEQDASTKSGTVVYGAVNANFNNQPVVDFATGSLSTASFTSNPTYPISIVIIAKTPYEANAGIVSGIVNTNRNSVGQAVGTGTGLWIIRGSSSTSASSTAQTAHATAHLLVATFDGSTGADTLSVDGTNLINANAGSNTLTGVSLGGDDGTAQFNGDIALAGIYEGDITADGMWSDFEAWVTSHYGITIA